jgi:hypothetical protein
MASYTSKQLLVFDNSSNANFQNWAGAIDAAIQAMGWTLTADTGQSNPASTAVPGSGSFIYRIYAMADALQTGSTTVFMKLKYGTGSGSPAAPRLQVQIGTSTDGAGNLTGQNTTNADVGLTNATGQGSTTFDCYFSGDLDRCSFMMWRSLNAQSAPFLVSVERTHNTDGTNSSDGAILNFMSSSSSVAGSHTTVAFGVGVYAGSGGRTYNFIGNVSGDSGLFNNQIAVYPAAPLYGKVGNPQTCLALISSNNIAEGAFFQTSLYSATRTYICSTNFSFQIYTTFRVCMRYD